MGDKRNSIFHHICFINYYCFSDLFPKYYVMRKLMDRLEEEMEDISQEQV